MFSNRLENFLLFYSNLKLWCANAISLKEYKFCRLDNTISYIYFRVASSAELLEHVIVRQKVSQTSPGFYVSAV